MTEDREKHLRMCEAISGLIASEGYKFAIEQLKKNCQESWGNTFLENKEAREALYLEHSAIVMLDRKLQQIANNFRTIELDRKAQKESGEREWLRT